MAKFRNKYRIGSHRKPYWDYSADALYFLTIVTQGRECILGDIVNAEMTLSEMGKIVDDEFLKSFEIRDELFLCEYVIMPNHLHTIVEIQKPNVVEPHVLDSVEPHGRAVHQKSTDPNHPSENSKNSDINDMRIKRNMPIRLPKSISSFMAGFKSAVNTQIDNFIDDHNLQIPKYNRNNHFFQPNYHDHIIRNDSEYQRIKNYIIQNPKKWCDDSLNNPK